MFAIIFVFIIVMSESAGVKVDVTTIKEKIPILDGKKVMPNCGTVTTVVSTVL